MDLHVRHHRITFPRRPLVMGIVNLNDDSFSGDGTLDITIALSRAEQMLRDGADIIDIGAESARTNRGPITVNEEVSRLLPFMEAWPALLTKLNQEPGPHNREPRTANREPLLSINTWRSEVVERVLPLGG